MDSIIDFLLRAWEYNIVGAIVLYYILCVVLYVVYRMLFNVITRPISKKADKIEREYPLAYHDFLKKNNISSENKLSTWIKITQQPTSTWSKDEERLQEQKRLREEEERRRREEEKQKRKERENEVRRKVYKLEPTSKIVKGRFKSYINERTLSTDGRIIKVCTAKVEIRGVVADVLIPLNDAMNMQKDQEIYLRPFIHTNTNTGKKSYVFQYLRYIIIETKTSYADTIRNISNPTFNKICSLSKNIFNRLPQNQQNKLFEALNHGVNILEEDLLMATYIYAYGKMHQAKLNHAFKKLPDIFLEQSKINIIDYGCGQALGTICFADFLHNNNLSPEINAITLIEPSVKSLKRAALHTSVFFPNTTIKTVNKTFDNLQLTDFICTKDIPTLHIFSNVLDMNNFSIDNLVQLLKNKIEGYNLFICVGPYFNYFEKDERLKIFSSLLSDNYYYEAKDSRNFISGKGWTCALSIFSVGRPNNNIYRRIDEINEDDDLPF